jgi:hypothetical protein
MGIPHFHIIRVTAPSLDRGSAKMFQLNAGIFYPITLICQVGEVSVKIKYAIFCMFDELPMLSTPATVRLSGGDDEVNRVFRVNSQLRLRSSTS